MDHWIDNPDALDQALSTLPAGSALPLDTEFIRERTYHPQLALVQVALPEQILLIDPIAVPVAPGFTALLVDPGIEKQMHSASEDLEAISHHYGVVPEPLFDTQIAAALCGLGAGMSYQKLVANLLDVALEKGETRSDWLARPLSDSQCSYAADDVRHLGAAAEQLKSRLAKLDRLEWLRYDCNRLVRSAHSGDDPFPHLAQRGAQRLDREAQARLCRLLRWRETQARATDRPRRWLLENDLAIDLCARPPENRVEFERRLDAHPKAPRRLRGELWREIEAPLGGDDLDIPLAVDPSPEQRNCIKRLQQAVVGVASALELPETLLANRRSLEMLAQFPDRWPEALQGWRRELLEAPLRAVLQAG